MMNRYCFDCGETTDHQRYWSRHNVSKYRCRTCGLKSTKIRPATWSEVYHGKTGKTKKERHDGSRVAPDKRAAS